MPFSDPYGQTKATPNHQRPVTGGQSIPSSGGSSGRSRAEREQLQTKIPEPPKPVIPKTSVSAPSTAISPDVLKEMSRIEQLRTAMAGGRTETIRTIDAQTGRPQEITTLRPTRDRFGRIIGGAGKVVDVRDVQTGRVTTTTFAPGRVGGSVRFTGGIVSQVPVIEEPEEVVGRFDSSPDLVSIEQFPASVFRFEGSDKNFTFDSSDRLQNLWDVKFSQDRRITTGTEITGSPELVPSTKPLDDFIVTTGTEIIQPPEIGSFERQREQRIRGDAISAIPTQLFGGVFDKQISPELARRGAEGGFLQRARTFLSPSFQYDVAVDTERVIQDVKDVMDLNKRLEKLNQEVTKATTNLDEGKIDEDRYNQVIERYNAFLERYNQEDSVKNLQGVRASAIESIAKSDLPSKDKIKYAAAIRLVQNVPLVVSPLARAVVGTEMVRTGLQSYDIAQTPTERTLAGVQIGGGVLLGLSGFIPSRGLTLRGTPGQAKWLKGATYASGITLGGSFGAMDYFGTLARTGDPDVALGTGVGTGLSLVGPLFVRDVGRAFSPKQLSKAFRDKRGSTTITETIPDSEYIYDYNTGRFIKKAQLTRVQAATEFKFASKERQLKILKEAFSNKVYIGDEAKQADLRLAKQFLDESKVSPARQRELLKEIVKDLFPKQEQIMLRAESEGIPLEIPKPKEPRLVTTESVYAGTGQYERTDSLISIRGRGRQSLALDSLSSDQVDRLTMLTPKSDFALSSMQESEFDSQLKDRMESKLKTDSALVLTTKSISALRERQDTIPRLDSLSRQEQRSDQRLDQKSMQRMRQSLRTDTTTRLVQRLPTRPRPTERRVVEDPLRIKITPPGFFRTSRGKKIGVTKRRVPEEEDKFFAFTKRYGQKKLIAVGRTPEEAISLGKQKVLGTLGATLKVKTARGESVKVSPDPFFRPSKTDPLAVVQRQVTPFGGRLTTRGERREIQLTRRTKQNKIGGM